jgi:hypothetical protein
LRAAGSGQILRLDAEMKELKSGWLSNDLRRIEAYQRACKKLVNAAERAKRLNLTRVTLEISQVELIELVSDPLIQELAKK